MQKLFKNPDFAKDRGFTPEIEKNEINFFQDLKQYQSQSTDRLSDWLCLRVRNMTNIGTLFEYIITTKDIFLLTLYNCLSYGVYSITVEEFFSEFT